MYRIFYLLQVLSGKLDNLPALYRKASSNIPSDNLQALLKLCLTDTNFPAFVGQVEKELEKMSKQNKDKWT